MSNLQPFYDALPEPEDKAIDGPRRLVHDLRDTHVWPCVLARAEAGYGLRLDKRKCEQIAKEFDEQTERLIEEAMQR